MIPAATAAVDWFGAGSNFLPKCRQAVVNPPYKQWISKQFKMIERMAMLKELKAAKLAERQAAKEAQENVEIPSSRS